MPGSWQFGEKDGGSAGPIAPGLLRGVDRQVTDVYSETCVRRSRDPGFVSGTLPEVKLRRSFPEHIGKGSGKAF